MTNKSITENDCKQYCMRWEMKKMTKRFFFLLKLVLLQCIWYEKINAGSSRTMTVNVGMK